MRQSSAQLRGVGLFGGTFDPVHIGHLRTALELKNALALAEMRLMPSAQPPHRAPPQASPKQRMAMLQLGLAGEPGLVADDRELRRDGPSYTVDSLIELRREIGPEVPLCLCIGMDALLTINQWHRWRELTDFAHLVVAVRPGWHLPDSGEVRDFVDGHRIRQTGELQTTAAGGLLIREMTLLPISATGIRQALQRGESIRYLVPDGIIDYINQNQLY
ncbi:nicotinate-nucleotide adenylyltransferase [Porticoccus sp.]|uniref:nicotinate-nucleotide adenylyltransferase n=1 Tax=Porticoccus sp. TaxID=2024853 RepID=UPI003F694E85